MLERINAYLRDDVAHMEAIIAEGLRSDVALVGEVAEHIFRGGGKGIRARLLLLLARAVGCDSKTASLLAATVECIHAATLLHDDIVDDSTMRRGRPSANITFGNAASLLVGDFVYAMAFQLMVRSERLAVMDVLARATKCIAEGEVYQLAYGFTLPTDKQHYFAIIERKTATLFAAAGELVAIAAGRETDRRCFADFGHQFGMTFQLIDDALDYVQPSETLGKQQGDDWCAGKVTLPLLHAFTQADDDTRATLLQLFAAHGHPTFADALALIRRYDGIGYTIRQAELRRDEALRLLTALPHSEAQSLLVDLCHFACARAY